MNYKQSINNIWEQFFIDIIKNLDEVYLGCIVFFFLIIVYLNEYNKIYSFKVNLNKFTIFFGILINISYSILIFCIIYNLFIIYYTIPQAYDEPFIMQYNEVSEYKNKMNNFLITNYCYLFDIILMDSNEQNNFKLLDEVGIYLKNKNDYKFDFYDKLLIYANWYDDNLWLKLADYFDKNNHNKFLNLMQDLLYECNNSSNPYGASLFYKIIEYFNNSDDLKTVINLKNIDEENLVIINFIKLASGNVIDICHMWDFVIKRYIYPELEYEIEPDVLIGIYNSTWGQLEDHEYYISAFDRYNANTVLKKSVIEYDFNNNNNNINFIAKALEYASDLNINFISTMLAKCYILIIYGETFPLYQEGIAQSYVEFSLDFLLDYINNAGITDYFMKGIFTIFLSLWFIIYYQFLTNKYIMKEYTNYEITFLYMLVSYLLLKLITSKDLITFILTLESQSLALCIICAFTLINNNLTKIEAALKLYITSATSSGFLLLGCVIIYGVTGTHQLDEISIIFKSRIIEQIMNIYENILSQFIMEGKINNETLLIYYTTLSSQDKNSLLLLIVGILCFFISIVFKLGQVPFHTWMIDVYIGGNILFVSYLAIFPKIAISYFFIKIIIFYFNSNILLLKLLFICGLITIIVGMLGALYQKKIKSFIAYSSITNMGYLFLISSAAYLEDASFLFALSIIFIINYALITLQIFTNIFFNIYMKGYNNTFINKEIENLSELSGFIKINKIDAIFLIISFLALIAIPPIIGFLVKFYLIVLLISKNLILISLLFLSLGVISTVYYLKIIKIIIFDNNNKNIFLIKNYIINKVIQTQIMFLQLLIFIKPLLLIIVIITLLL
jgi:NADH:ubiquinone oxidoreductase subunit 2 (subunit N)